MDLMDYRRKIIANSPHLMSASGAVASFSDGANLPLENLVVDIEPVQSGTGDPSPTNIRPISGRNGVKVTKCGKNLLDKSVFADYSNWLHPINTSGFGTDDNNRGCFLPKLKANTSYTISFDWDTTFPTYLYLCKVNSEGYGTLVAHLTTDIIKNKKLTFTLAEGERAYLRMGSTVNITFFNTNFAKFGNCMLEEGSTATQYEPYNGVDVSIDLGQTVYGATINPLTGMMTVDRAMVDLGTLNWTRINTQSPHWRFWAIVTGMLKDSTLMSNQYAQITPSAQWTGAIGIATQLISGTPAVMVTDERYETAADFKTAMSGVQLVYELATPYEIQLTPHQIRSLYGNNAIFADTGNVALEYWAHP